MIAAFRPLILRVGAVVALVAVLSACDKPRAQGNAGQILVVSSQAVWDALEDDISSALQPTIFTVRDESVFDIAHVDPAREDGLGNLSVQRQILLIGPAEDAYVAEAIDAYRGEVPPAPSIFQVRGLWAQEQTVTVLLMPSAGAVDAIRPLLPTVGETYLGQFEAYARSRMFVTGVNEEMRDSLRNNAGFALTLPRVYRGEVPEPGVYLFRNDQPDPSQLIRNITVTSRPVGEVEPSAELAHSWRAELAERLTQPAQITQMDSAQSGVDVEANGRRALQTQGIWSNPPNQWPAAGPYITRLVECPRELFLIDAWLYAPGTPKYEYMFQLNTILDSFACAEDAAAL